MSLGRGLRLKVCHGFCLGCTTRSGFACGDVFVFFQAQGPDLGLDLELGQLRGVAASSERSSSIPNQERWKRVRTTLGHK